MRTYNTFSLAELKLLEQALHTRYDEVKRENLNLDMSRGKPCPEQLGLSMGLLDVLSSKDTLKSSDGMDVRNYGGLDGIPEAKALFAQMLEVPPNQVIIGGNSSLSMMHDTVTRALLHGVCDSDAPWASLPRVKFLCPSPGYDRHFAICEHFQIDMITVEMTSAGPDMDQVERLVREDELIKGIWCVPKYSNPEGITYLDEVVDRLAQMQTKANDFRIFWDDAYSIHHLTDQPDLLKNMLEACRVAGNSNRVFIFSSTSKVSFAGSGIGVMAASEANMKDVKSHLAIQTIGSDKINQLQHVRFFEHEAGLHTHMQKHANILRPKFEMVIRLFERELNGLEIASWNKPNGGYFISLNTLDGCAKDVVKAAADAGVKLTPAGATFPYGKDPRDRNIRIAPTFPSLTELEKAIEVLCLCVQKVSVRKLMDQMK